jgi:hypothetical protein
MHLNTVSSSDALLGSSAPTPIGALSFEPLSEDQAERWDELIAPYPERQVFHSQAWLDYLATSRGVRIRKWAITDGCGTVGYFCAGQFTKGPFQVLGSPLKGWGTNSLGPVLAPAVDLRAFLLAFDELAAREKIAMAELEHPQLNAETMAEFGYEPTTLWTYQVELDPDEQVMLKRMSKGRRSGIKKALNSGLRVEERYDLTLADQYYDQFARIMHGKGLAPTYPREVPRLLMQHLAPAGRLLALAVHHPDGRVLATGLFPYDNGTLYFWGGASVAERELCPNDLMHCHAMRVGAQRGLRRYDLSGWGRFKKEFGGELITVQRWHKCYWRSARWARRAYEFYFQQRIRLSGLLQRAL